MAGLNKRKQSLYFPEKMLEEVKKEAIRLDRSLSWIIQRSWLVASESLKKIPSTNDVIESSQGSTPIKDGERST